MPSNEYRVVIIQQNGDVKFDTFDNKMEAWIYERSNSDNAVFHGMWYKEVGTDDSTFKPISSVAGW